MTIHTHQDGDPVRRPIQALAAVALVGLIGALACIGLAAASRSVVALGLAALFVAAALIALLLLIIGLASDPLRARILTRLREIERRLQALEGGVQPRPAPPIVTVPQEDQPSRPAEDAPPRPSESEAPARETRRPVPPGVPAPSAAPQPTAGKAFPVPTDGGWELALGSRWLGRIGAAVLVVAVALFLKLGWDQGWFRPTPLARVLLGFGLGVALVALGELARRRGRYAALAQALGGAGLGAMVLSVWAAVRLYSLLSAFPGLVLVALIAAGLAAYSTATQSRALAVLALASGFLAPRLLSAPAGGDLFLVALTAAFSAGGLAAALTCGWWEVPWLAAAGTLIDITPLLFQRHPADWARLVHAGGLLLITAVFLAAAALNVRRDYRPNATTSTALVAGGISVWALLAALGQLDPMGHTAQALLSIAFLAVAAGTWYVAQRAGLPVQGVTAGAFGVAAFVPAVVLPMILFEKAMIGLGWAVLGLGAGWYGLASKRRGWQQAAAAFSAIAWFPALATVGQLTTWSVPIVFGTMVLLFVLAHLTHRESDTEGSPSRLLLLCSGPAAALSAVGWAQVLAVKVFGGIPTGVGRLAAIAELRSILMLAAAVALVLIARRRPGLPPRLAAAALMVFSLAPFSVSGNTSLLVSVLPHLRILAAALAALVLAAGAERSSASAWDRWLAWLTGLCGAGLALLQLWPRWAAVMQPSVAFAQEGVLLVAGAALLGAGFLAARWTGRPPGGWLENAGWVTLLAAASHRLGYIVQAGEASTTGGTVPLSVLWGLAGLALLGYGLLSRKASRRHLGLLVLGVTVVKIFVRDLAAAGTVVRVLAFAVTGAALLFGSFLYVRFRGALEPPPPGEETAEESPDAW